MPGERLRQVKVLHGAIDDPPVPAFETEDPVSDQFFDLQQSYGRCLRDRNFITRFYEVFMASDPQVAAMFANTDFQTQRLALRRGISVAIFHASGSAVVKRTTEQMADVHSRSGRCPVSPRLYPLWVDSLLKVVAEADEEADAQLLARWRQAMATVVDTFSQRFDGARA